MSPAAVGDMSLAEMLTMSEALAIRHGKRGPRVDEATREAGMKALAEMFRDDPKVKLH